MYAFTYAYSFLGIHEDCIVCSYPWYVFTYAYSFLGIHEDDLEFSLASFAYYRYFHGFHGFVDTFVHIGGRAHKDIEFQPDEDSPAVYVSWDPKITCIRKDQTMEEVGA